MRSSEVSSEGDVELSLGLTLGGRTNVNKKYSNSQSLTANAAATTDFAGIFCGDGFTAGSRSRQIEAKKDQNESQRMVKKRQKVDDRQHQHQHHQAETNPNPNPKINLIPNHNPNSNVTMNMIPNHSTTSTATNATAGRSDQPTAPPPYGHFPVMPMQYSYHPYANGYGFPYMVPWYMNVPSSGGQDGATSGRNVFQPVPTRSFHTFQGIATSGKEVVQSGGGGEDGCGGSIHRAHSMTGSQGSSFSAVSEFQSPSQQQGGSSSSSDTRGGCGGGAGQVNQGSTEEKSPLFQQHSSSNQLAVESSIKQTTTTTTDNSEQAKNKEKKSSMVSPMPEMPCVSTTGDGPNGKKITGFLYRYNKTEVSIVCVCHGSFFSPAEFIKHAGGTDVSHPLRHIVIVPS